MKTLNQFIVLCEQFLFENKVVFHKDLYKKSPVEPTHDEMAMDRIKSGSLTVDPEKETPECPHIVTEINRGLGGSDDRPHKNLDWAVNKYKQTKKITDETTGEKKKVSDGAFKLEDMDHVGRVLSRFNHPEVQRHLKASQKQGGLSADANAYKSHHEMESAVNEIASKHNIDFSVQKEENKPTKNIRDDVNSARRLIHGTDQEDNISPLRVYSWGENGDHEQAKRVQKFLHSGGNDGNPQNNPHRIGTNWCTATTNDQNNRTPWYLSLGPMYTFHHTDNDGKHRVSQFAAGNGEFQTEANRSEIKLDDFVQKHPDLKNVEELQGLHKAFPLSAEKRSRIVSALDSGNCDSLSNGDYFVAARHGLLNSKHVENFLNDPNNTNGHRALMSDPRNLSEDQIRKISSFPNSSAAHAGIIAELENNRHRYIDSSSIIKNIARNPKSTLAHSRIAQARYGIPDESVDDIFRNPKSDLAHFHLLDRGFQSTHITDDHIRDVSDKFNRLDSNQKRSFLQRFKFPDHKNFSPEMTEENLSHLANAAFAGPNTFNKIVDHPNCSSQNLSDVCDNLSHKNTDGNPEDLIFKIINHKALAGNRNYILHGIARKFNKNDAIAKRLMGEKDFGSFGEAIPWHSSSREVLNSIIDRGDPDLTSYIGSNINVEPDVLSRAYHSIKDHIIHHATLGNFAENDSADTSLLHSISEHPILHDTTGGRHAASQIDKVLNYIIFNKNSDPSLHEKIAENPNASINNLSLIAGSKSLIKTPTFVNKLLSHPNTNHVVLDSILRNDPSHASAVMGHEKISGDVLEKNIHRFSHDDILAALNHPACNSGCLSSLVNNLSNYSFEPLYKKIIGHEKCDPEVLYDLAKRDSRSYFDDIVNHHDVSPETLAELCKRGLDKDQRKKVIGHQDFDLGVAKHLIYNSNLDSDDLTSILNHQNIKHNSLEYLSMDKLIDVAKSDNNNPTPLLKDLLSRNNLSSGARSKIIERSIEDSNSEMIDHIIKDKKNLPEIQKLIYSGKFPANEDMIKSIYTEHPENIDIHHELLSRKPSAFPKEYIHKILDNINQGYWHNYKGIQGVNVPSYENWRGSAKRFVKACSHYHSNDKDVMMKVAKSGYATSDFLHSAKGDADLIDAALSHTHDEVFSRAVASHSATPTAILNKMADQYLPRGVASLVAEHKNSTKETLEKLMSNGLSASALASVAKNPHADEDMIDRVIRHERTNRTDTNKRVVRNSVISNPNSTAKNLHDVYLNSIRQRYGLRDLCNMSKTARKLLATHPNVSDETLRGLISHSDTDEKTSAIANARLDKTYVSKYRKGERRLEEFLLSREEFSLL